MRHTSTLYFIYQVPVSTATRHCAHTSIPRPSQVLPSSSDRTQVAQNQMPMTVLPPSAGFLVLVFDHKPQNNPQRPRLFLGVAPVA
ncbi:hypothetical protein LIA77_06981 [Sarocladium implicatum]|nr:hypothetical protein LIA77_06981 [Sarocladium implicatum]